MADIRTIWNPDDLVGDWLLAGNVLDSENELVTAVAISLFTHRTAEDGDRLPNGETAANTVGQRRGWWADHEGDLLYGATPIGSRLWLLSREKQTEETRARAEEYIREALVWITQARLATAIDIVVEWFAPERLGALITIYRGQADAIAIRFERLWDGVRG